VPRPFGGFYVVFALGGDLGDSDGSGRHDRLVFDGVPSRSGVGSTLRATSMMVLLYVLLSFVAGYFLGRWLVAWG
jgi:hypothetical protein